VAVTPELLARTKSLDDLLELAQALGFAPYAEELNQPARERLGLAAPPLRALRAAIIGRRGPFLLYGVQLVSATRAVVAQAAERLARATPGELHLLFAVDHAGTTLAVAAVEARNGGPRARQFRVALASPSPVAAEIISGLEPRHGETPLALAVRAADVLAEEGLTGRFFREFVRLHARAAENLRDAPRASSGERRDLALVMMTRVLFLYFVQARGWLAGRGDFLPSLLDTALGRGHPFHHTVFEPLCFGALSTPVAARSRAARELGEVPFLNGGLFERHALERHFPRAHLGNETWRELFDELFERFHFTVRDAEDRDAVDPEMLGRVFEGLMARDRRRSGGTYFTPRELLRRIVSAALEAALAGRTTDAIRSVRVLDPAVGSGAFLLETLAQLEEHWERHWPCVAPGERRRTIVRDCLYGVDVDPMAVRLAELRLWLALVADESVSWREVAPLPNLDQNLRQGDSLLSPLDLASPAACAGALTRPAAVAERRAAYFTATGREKATLAREIRAAERAHALAAANAGIEVLTSRLAEAAAASGRDLFGSRTRRSPALRWRVAAWRRERRDLVALRRRVAESDALPFFSYDIHFGDVMAAGGFDILLGNPPWVRGERLPPAMRTALSGRYATFGAVTTRAGFAHLPDLAVAFVERALQLTREGGVVAMLLPAKLLRAGYASELRLLLRRRSTVLMLDDRAHGPSSGFAATVFPMICVLRRGPPEPSRLARVRVECASGVTLEGLASQRDLALEEAPSGARWLGLPGDLVRALRAALGASPALGTRFRPLLGIKTGANGVFVRPEDRADELPESHRRPAVLGRDVTPFLVRPSSAVLAALDHRGAPLESVPDDVASYLRPYRHALAHRADARGGAPPWALFRTDLLRGRWLVVWRDIAPFLQAAFLELRSARSPVPLNTCYGIVVPDQTTARWMAALLNSSPVSAMAAALAERASGGAFRFSASVLAALPVPAITTTTAVGALTEIGRDASRGEPWNQDELDTHARAALGLEGDVAGALAHLANALRRNAGGHS
jgi:hypothetical protein